MKQRDPLFDILKMIAMFMVVLSHVLAAQATTSKGVVYIKNFIVAVNMPLFFAISGYFARGLMRRLEVRELASRLIRYFWPVVIFGVIGAIFEYVFVRAIDLRDVPSVAVRKTLFGAWFFYSLAFCELVVFVMCKCGCGKSTIVKGALVYCVFLLVPDFWYKSDTLNMIPFYLLGLYALPWFMGLNRSGWMCIGAFAMLVYLGAVVFGGDFWNNGMAFYTNSLNVYSFNLVDLKMACFRLALGTCGVVGLVWVTRGVVRKLALFSSLGTLTLGIYFVHFWCIRAAVSLGWRPKTVVAICVCAFFLFLTSHMIVWVTKRWPISDKFLWGFDIRDNRIVREKP